MAEVKDSAQNLYQMVLDKVEFAKHKMEELTLKLKEIDTKELLEKPSAYLNPALQKTQDALAELTKQAQSLKDNATDIPVRAFSGAFARANEGLAELKSKAKAFDDQYKLSTKVSDVVAHPGEQASVAVASASSYVTEAASAAVEQLKGVSDGLKCRVMAAAEQGVERVMPVAAAGDKQLHITEGVAMVAQQVKAFDEKFHVTDKITDLDRKFAVSSYIASAWSSFGQLDQRLTGGKVEAAGVSAYDMGLQMAGYLKGKFEESKSATATSTPAAESKVPAESQPQTATPSSDPDPKQ